MIPPICKPVHEGATELPEWLGLVAIGLLVLLTIEFICIAILFIRDVLDSMKR